MELSPHRLTLLAEPDDVRGLEVLSKRCAPSHYQSLTAAR